MCVCTRTHTYMQTDINRLCKTIIFEMSNSLRPMDYLACQPPLFMGFSGQKYWSGLPFPSPGDLPDPEMEPGYKES